MSKMSSLKATDIINSAASLWSQTPPAARKAFGIFLLLKFLLYSNRKLSQWSLNNWKSAAKFRPEKEIVLITGGSGGIGKQIVQDLAVKARGVTIVILDIQEPGFELPPNTHFYKTDITSPQVLKQSASEIRKTHGSPTVLINNAGTGANGTIVDVPEETVRLTYEVNTLAHFWTVKEFLPDMIKNDHGHVVTVASMASFIALGEMSSYAGSKASAMAFHEVLTQELKYWHKAPRVRTSIIHPLWVRTPLITALVEAGKKFRQPILEPEDVSKAVLKQILTQSSGQVIIPSKNTYYSLIRALPNWSQEFLRGIGSRILKDVRDAYAELLKERAGTKTEV